MLTVSEGLAFGGLVGGGGYRVEYSAKTHQPCVVSDKPLQCLSGLTANNLTVLGLLVYINVKIISFGIFVL